MKKSSTLFFAVTVLLFYMRVAMCTTPRILFVYQAVELDMQQSVGIPDAFKLRGSSVCKLNQIEQLCKAGADIRILVVGDHDYAVELEKKGIRVYQCEKMKNGKVNLQGLAKKIDSIFKENPIDIIHCNEMVVVMAARQVSGLKKNNVKIVLTLHVDPKGDCGYLRGIDGVLCVGPVSQEKVIAANSKAHLGINIVDQIPPFFNVDRFLSFTPPVQTRDKFFLSEFGISLIPGPVISSVANFYATSKNHSVLINAISIVVNEFKIPVNLVLVGDGIRRFEMEHLTQVLNLEKYVHFVGLTQKVPEINFYSDVCALTSDCESFGIALAEAAFLKRPLIGTQGTGMEAIVLNGKTGLLFKKGNQQDLAEKLALLIGTPDMAKQLGQNAYDHAKAQFLPEIGIEKLLTFYKRVMGGKQRRKLIQKNESRNVAVMTV